MALVICLIDGSGESRGVKGESEHKGAGVGGATEVDMAGRGVGNTRTSSCRAVRSTLRLQR